MPSNVKPVADWKTAFEPPKPEVDAGVSIADGRLVLGNGTRQRWLAEFDGDAKRLDLALVEALGSVQPNSRSHSLQVQVEKQLARMVSNRRDGDKRYADATTKNAKLKAAKGHQGLSDVPFRPSLATVRNAQPADPRSELEILEAEHARA